MENYHILQLIGGGEIGGAEQHVLTLLQELDSARFNLSSGCLIDGPFARLTEELGIPTLRFPMKHALDLSPLPGLLAKLRKEKIALIHTHGSRANLLGRLAGRRAKIPVVSTYHSSLSKDYLSPKAALVALGLDRLTLPLTSGIITVSEALSCEVASRGGKNLHTIYNGIQPLPQLGNKTYRQNQRTLYRKQWEIPDNALVLGSIARLHPTKGLETLIDTAAQLLPHFPNLHVLLVGEGPLRSTLEEKLKNSGIPYTLPGFIPDGYQTLPAMDLFILPSLSEGMGLVLLEAMQAHLPIVATRVGGIPEVIRDGQDGLLIPPADSCALAEACETLLTQPLLAMQLVQSSLNRWQSFNIDHMIQKTENFYEEILC
ncbi:glycosyltransferase [Desulfitobacterium metallireducens]|uniref:Glycosyltransferase n=1 Tax=Desulfitobacterium metallireducens DSM 15288 TaxID=871968 RepID=W0EFI2_9FIRM|nr:glycosyltransferase [Desulfitobacterium metallireducens]AHF08258.1 glycosyltransferase [Desulfitobacterium metallireducens DSM 15288]